MPIPGPAPSPPVSTGEARFCYTGSNAGDDTISAYADTNPPNNTQDLDEPGDTASVSWTANGQLEVVKRLVPKPIPAASTCRSDGTTIRQDAGDGDSTGKQPVSADTHTVGEVGGSTPATSLDDYVSQISCRDGNGSGSTVAEGNTSSR